MFALLLAQNFGLCCNYNYLPEFGDFDLFWTLQISLNSEVCAPKIIISYWVTLGISLCH
jgi:hypothetical protein